MTTSQLLKLETVKPVNNIVEKDILGYYTSDLLSWVMGHVKEEKYLLLTVLNSMNVIAVATLLDLSGVVFCENVNPTEEMQKKANEEGINLFSTSLSSAELLKLIYES